MSYHQYSMLTGNGNEDGNGIGTANPRASSEEELWKATDAMQRAADAMIAVTESFRRQLHEQDEPSRRPTSSYQPYRPEDIVGFNSDALEGGSRSSSEQRSSKRPKSPATPPHATPSASSTSNSRSSRRSLTTQVSPSSAHRSGNDPRITSPAVTLATTAAVTPVPPAAVLHEFLPRKQSASPMPPVNTNISGPSSSRERPGSDGDDGDMVDVDLSPITNNSNGTGGTSTTKCPGTGSTPTIAQSFTPIRQNSSKHLSSPVGTAPSTRHTDFVTAMEHSRNSAMFHPSPLTSHPAGSSPCSGPSAHTSPNPNSGTAGISFNKPVYSSTSYKGPYSGGPNSSITSFASMQQNMGGLANVPRDSMDEFNAPLFPRPTYGSRGYGRPYRAQGPGGINRNALSRSLKRAAAHIPRLSPPLADAEPVMNEKNGLQSRLPLQPPPGPVLGKIQEILFVLVICLADGLMLAGLAQGIAPMFDILASFPGKERGEVNWYTAAYALTAGVFVLPGSRLGEVFGPKRVFFLGFLWFALWSLIAGFGLAAQNAGGDGNTFFVFCRAMQGIGPGILLPNGQVLVGKVFPHGEQKGPARLASVATILFGAAAPVGFVVGSVMSALFAANASWPWAFWTLAAVCLAASGLALLALPSIPAIKQDTDDDGLYALLDIPGTVLLMAGLALFDIGWNEATTCGWQTPYVYFLVILGLVILAGFAYVERHAPHPLMPLARMRAETAVILLAILAAWMAWGILVVNGFRFLLEQRRLGPLMASAQMCADFAALGLAGSLLLAFLFKKRPGVSPQAVLVAGVTAFVISSVLLATAPVGQSYWINVFLATLFVPLGMELTVPAATAMMDRAMPEGEREAGPWLVVMIVNYGVSLGLGVAGTVERSTGREGELPLRGLRGGQWMGTGLASLGLGVAVCLMVAASRRRRRNRKSREGEEEEKERGEKMGR